MGVMLYGAGKAMVQPPALNAWQEVTRAAKLIQDHINGENADYLFKTLLANQIISMLVTGFEVYLQPIRITCYNKRYEQTGDPKTKPTANAE